MRDVRLRAVGWGDIDTAQVTGFKDRFMGLRTRGVDSVLIDRRSIHTFGLKEEIEIVAIARDMTVIESRSIAPNRVVTIRSAGSILELPGGSSVPPPGTVIEVLDG